MKASNDVESNTWQITLKQKEQSREMKQMGERDEMGGGARGEKNKMDGRVNKFLLFERSKKSNLNRRDIPVMQIMSFPTKKSNKEKK